MSALGENEGLNEVVDHLAARFPSLSREHVSHVVSDKRHRLETAAVSAFVPALVEHAAMEELRKEADPVRLRVEDSGSPMHPTDEPLQSDPMERERREREQHGGFLFGDLGGRPT